ncbi:MAG: IPT/TIG domain-containing protein [Solirubrobacteraceae bacterium]
MSLGVAPVLAIGAARRRGLAALSIACCLARGGAALASAASASAAGAHAVHGKLHLRKRALGAGAPAARPRWVCPKGACEAIVAPRPVRVGDGFALPQSRTLLQGGGELGGLDPEDLRSAYSIPATGGTGQTVALIDAFGYPQAESDIARYRERYGLPACTTLNGCFEKVNEKGEQANYPEEEAEWDGEAALDEDMVSAACPGCHILLVEGSTEAPADLGESVNTAARLGATEISNSYGYPEQDEEFCGTTGCSQFNADYAHPGVMIFASAGDSGFEDTYDGLGLQTNFPASSPNVVAVGGTALLKDRKAARGWREEVWNEPRIFAATGGGCSRFESKPAWQADAGCAGRTDNDVAADAAVKTGVSVRLDGEWQVYGGTSVASPLLAGIEAHASSSERSLGADAFYAAPGSLYDVTEGFSWDPFNGGSECAPNEYLCNAEVGYDGPTGLGTPDGVLGVLAAPTVTKVAPKSGPATGGTTVTITGSGFTGAEEVKFATGEARKLDVVSSTSMTAESPPGSVGTVNVTVTTPGGTSAVTTKDRFKYKKAK